MTESTRAVARYDGPRTTADLREYALALAFDTNPEGRYKDNQALPVAFRGNPGAVAFAVEYAKALDVSPITALIGIHIVDGKPTASAGLISALVRRAGHKIRTWVEGSVEGGDLVGITTIVRADDPDFTYRSEWTLSRAVRAGLCTTVLDPATKVWKVSAKGRSGKPGAWETYTENMVKSRSITECARDGVEDAILGVHYTPEELGVDVDESGEPVYTVTNVQSTRDDQQPPPRQNSTPDPAPAAPSREEAAPPAAGDDVELADHCRAWILSATSREHLAAGWKGTTGLNQEIAGNLICGDETGIETNVLDLFRRQTAAIDAGNPLVDIWGGGDDGGTPSETPQEPPSDAGGTGRVLTADEAVAKAETGNGDTVEAHTDPTRPGASTPPATPNLDALNKVLAVLPPEQMDEVVSWCRLNEADPRKGEDHASIILEAITSGDAFSNKSLAAMTEAGTDPLALVERVLGGVVIDQETVTDPAELHRREIAERQEEARREAREATPAHGGRPPAGAGHEAFKQNRRQLAGGTTTEGDNR